ncbi:bifunctional DNA primase/polymerase [Streptomyces sp. NPDC060194]|uniref:bifunctional DNA primase/polymerase n=1 Tax=Streptomyces sp. NPDC060194 TaxID=3347069 RepID=UPI0036573258
MSAWQQTDLLPAAPSLAGQVTPAGAEWLVSAGAHPQSLLTQWRSRPESPAVLPCGSPFDVVNVPAVFGRRMLDRLWEEGPGSGPVAAHRGRMLLFAAPGTAHRLPALMRWEEWSGQVPALLCHGQGDAVTVPPLRGEAPASRWLVAPDTRHPWLPGPEVVLWACVRAARATAGAEARDGADGGADGGAGGADGGAGISISPPADQGAKVYDVSRRR